MSRTSVAGCPPRHSTPVTDRPSFGAAVVETQRALGWDAIPWQRLVARVALEHDGGQLVYKDVDVSCPRQQGKSSLILSIMLQRMLSSPGAVGGLRCAEPAGCPSEVDLGVVAADPPLAARWPV
jgi:hypothetical protein